MAEEEGIFSSEVKKMSEKKNMIFYFGLVAVALAITIIGIVGSTMVDQYGPHNVFYMLGEYFGPKGEHQGFISLFTPILMFLTAGAEIALGVIWVLAGIKNKPGKILFGILIPIILVQIVWLILFANFVAFEMDIFFDMTRSAAPGWAYWFVMIATIVQFAGCIVYSILRKKW